MINKHCSHCGAEHIDTDFPRKCPECKQLTWVNPIPVSVILQSVRGLDASGQERVGILIGRRAIPPHIGEWGLIGGYMVCEDKTLLEAGLREFHEETDIDLGEVSADDFEIKSSFCDGRALLVFSVAKKAIDESRLVEFKKNTETSELRVAWEPEELCFSSHTDALAAYFKTNAA